MDDEAVKSSTWREDGKDDTSLRVDDVGDRGKGAARPLLAVLTSKSVAPNTMTLDFFISAVEKRTLLTFFLVLSMVGTARSRSKEDKLKEKERGAEDAHQL